MAVAFKETGDTRARPVSIYTEDSDGNLVLYKDAVIVEAGLNRQIVSDFDSQDLLNGILKQLKIMNIHMAILTDNFIEKQEVE